MFELTIFVFFLLCLGDEGHTQDESLGDVEVLLVAHVAHRAVVAPHLHNLIQQLK